MLLPVRLCRSPLAETLTDAHVRSYSNRDTYALPFPCSLVRRCPHARAHSFTTASTGYVAIFDASRDSFRAVSNSSAKPHCDARIYAMAVDTAQPSALDEQDVECKPSRLWHA